MNYIKTFVFLDLETTGLPAYHVTKITEMNLIAVNRNHLISAEIPRVLNKLNLCFQPLKLIPPQVTNITGLDNYLLEDILPFSETTFNLLENFLRHQPAPICLVAHNGYNFDFPILKYELNCIKKQLSDDILCIDSLPAFRHIFSQTEDKLLTEMNDDADAELLMVSEHVEKSLIEGSTSSNSKDVINYQQLINETTPKKQILSKRILPEIVNKNNGQNNISKRNENYRPKARRKLLFNENNKPESFSLQSLYSFIMQTKLTNAHQAEVDTYALMKCCGAVREQFFKYADENYKSFNQISAF